MEPQKDPKKWPYKMTPKEETPDSCTQSSRPCWNQHHEIYGVSQNWIFPSKSVRFSKQISNGKILAPVRDNPSEFSLRRRPESQLWRRHQNLYLLANQDDLTLERFYYSGFITELQRFFCHIGNLWNNNIFWVPQYPIEFALQIIWTVKCYDPISTLEKWWPVWLLQAPRSW